ncbi:MAG: hypothetical protein R3A47_09425 [Polyangiales bacterium]
MDAVTSMPPYGALSFVCETPTGTKRELSTSAIQSVCSEAQALVEEHTNERIAILCRAHHHAAAILKPFKRVASKPSKERPMMSSRRVMQSA